MKKKILITVKTYPTPSKTYDELVCTAGITDDNQLIRIFPVPFRHLNDYQKFHKYEWIIADIEKSSKDKRIESYKIIDTDSIEQIEKIDKKIEQASKIIPLCSKSIEELNKKKYSLGIIKPNKIIDFSYEKVEDEWTDKQKHFLYQPTINDYILETDKIKNTYKPIEKIPFKFSFKFQCNDVSCKTHTLMIEDWEVGALYRNCIHKYNYSPAIAAEKVKDKFFNKICSDKNDVYFYVGTHYRFPTWMILGLFYIKKENMSGKYLYTQGSIEDFLL